MFVGFVVVTVLAAAANIYAATVDFARAGWVLDNMAKLGIPQSWLSPLGALKAAGAVGLLAGIAVPSLGVAAGLGLVLYFSGALVTVVRSDHAQIPYPTVFLALAGAALALRLATL